MFFMYKYMYFIEHWVNLYVMGEYVCINLMFCTVSTQYNELYKWVVVVTHKSLAADVKFMF